jgi:SPP1 gp7 family putative phage head morphogenesis protein
MSGPSILLDAFQQKPAAAIEYLKRKGYTFSWNWFDTWRDAHARAFTVAKVAKVELLRDIRNAVQSAISEGKTLQQFKKELTPKLQKAGWWGKKEHVDEETGEVTEVQLGSPRRLKTIYETNLQTAYMAGRYKGQMEAADDLPYLQYIAVMDGKTTDTCRDMHGKVFRADDPIWNEFYPPNHWGCRARVRSLSERQVQRMGLVPESSEGRIVEKEVIVGKGAKARKETVTGLNIGHGKTFWTGAGWDYNPGKEAWMPDLSVYHENDASAFIKDGFGGPMYRQFLDARGALGGEIPIAAMPKDYLKHVGGNVKNNTVWLSADSLFKNVEHHGELTTDDYLHIQNVVEDASLVLQNPKERLKAHFLEVGEQSFMAVVKATVKGDKLYLVSFRYAKEKDINDLKKTWRVIKG